jgi:hypothetical protein
VANTDVSSFIPPSGYSGSAQSKSKKKADVAGHPKVSDHVGMLFNEPPGEPGCSLLSHPTNIIPVESGAAFTVNASPL